ncbi:MAG: M23 family metallopeptidase [Bacteriovoracaceae bacterium]|nr:M23 family metallopeptidase [Bacteriovoracaceae bacterium]
MKIFLLFVLLSPFSLLAQEQAVALLLPSINPEALEPNEALQTTGAGCEMPEHNNFEIVRGTTEFFEFEIPEAIRGRLAQTKLVCYRLTEDPKLKYSVQVPFTKVPREQKIIGFIREMQLSPKLQNDCFLEIEKEAHLVGSYLVLDKVYPISEKPMPVKGVRGEKVSPEIEAKLKAEGAALGRAYRNSSPRPLFRSPFIEPLEGPISSPYGTERKYKNAGIHGRHSGLDYGVPEGTEVYAVNDGIVTGAISLYYEGNILIIDHGMEIFSLYMHLSQFKVKVGDKVKQGDLVALSGGTGKQTTGPHLHWSMRLSKDKTDPRSVVEASKKFIEARERNIGKLTNKKLEFPVPELKLPTKLPPIKLQTRQ